jgi:hypothetical protein
VVLDVEAEAEEDVVPDEHLHLRLLTGVDRHHVPCIQSHNMEIRESIAFTHLDKYLSNL